MTVPKIEQKSEIIDGTEYRHVLLRIRENGMKLLADALANKKRGFVSFSNPRVELLDDQIMIVLPSNTGSIDDYVYLGLDIFVPLTEEEIAATNPKDQNATVT